MVLDVTDYHSTHPGGSYLITHNIGRDISKYFYGAYQMENYTGKETAYNHSSIAKNIVNKLMIARLTNDAPEFIA